MASIDPRYQQTHDDLSELIGNARELPFSQIQNNTRLLIAHSVSEPFSSSLKADVRGITERIETVEGILVRIPTLLQQLIVSTDAAGSAPGLKEELSSLAHLWKGKREVGCAVYAC